MWWPVLCVLVSNFSPSKALSNENLENQNFPDFTDYEDVSEYNFSELFETKRNQQRKLQRNDFDLEPLTPMEQDFEMMKETQIAYGTTTEIKQNSETASHSQDTIIDSVSTLLSVEHDEDISESEIVITKKISLMADVRPFESQRLASKSTVINVLPNMGYQNNVTKLATTHTHLDESNTFRSFQMTGARRQDDLFQGYTTSTTTAGTYACWPWPICHVWHWAVVLLSKTETKDRKPYNYSRKLDIEALVDMLDYVAWDYGNRFNLTRKFNDSLLRYDIPTCEYVPTPTTPPETTSTAPSTINFDEAQIIAKCFVCGLKEEGIPRSSACADAFSGDFIPLVKVDPKARGQIASFRKYCRFLNVPGYMEIEKEPQSIFGRFTGGCTVRWADLTSVYTQRTCRNRRRALTGKHFASKRMAKLEMTISHLDNGCIISPMATLLPVSRGISLYARFHVCVCTGSWCNKAALSRHRFIINILIIFVTYIWG